jgi:hypothetical protein
MWISIYLVEKHNATVRSSDTTQQDAGIHEAVNSRPRDDAELIDELRQLKEQVEKAILEETATVTTKEDDDDRRQMIDLLQVA